jgi:hypothetical protein
MSDWEPSPPARLEYGHHGGTLAAAAAPIAAAPLFAAAASGVQAPVDSVQDQRPAAPPAAQAQHGPNEGDVFLDGMLVGRWMSRFLDQEAGRAATGPTGFDPRRGRLLPGATVGG